MKEHSRTNGKMFVYVTYKEQSSIISLTVETNEMSLPPIDQVRLLSNQRLRQPLFCQRFSFAHLCHVDQSKLSVAQMHCSSLTDWIWNSVTWWKSNNVTWRWTLWLYNMFHKCFESNVHLIWCLNDFLLKYKLFKDFTNFNHVIRCCCKCFVGDLRFYLLIQGPPKTPHFFLHYWKKEKRLEMNFKSALLLMLCRWMLENICVTGFCSQFKAL